MTMHGPRCSCCEKLLTVLVGYTAKKHLPIYVCPACDYLPQRKAA